MWTTTKKVDPYFYSGLVVSLFFFSLELLVQSCVVDDFKYGFFFWLDFIATLSLVPDIYWILDFLAVLIHLDPSSVSLDVKPGIPLSESNNSNITKVIRSFRLIRLIRIIKLYNYAVKSNAEADEAKLREQ
jgi:hypothetical protein